MHTCVCCMWAWQCMMWVFASIVVVRCKMTLLTLPQPSLLSSTAIISSQWFNGDRGTHCCTCSTPRSLFLQRCFYFNLLRTAQSNSGQVGSREREFWNLRCVTSAIGRSDSSNLFCCSWAATRFVWCRDSWPHVVIGQDHSREPQFVSCRWCLPCVHGVTAHVCFLQVESLIENEAEKDYLYDVLRIYHEWVPILTAWLQCAALMLSFHFSLLFFLCSVHECINNFNFLCES